MTAALLAALAMSASSAELADRLKGHVEFLAGEIGERSHRVPGSLDRAKDYIAGRLEDFGYSPRLEEYPAQGGPYHNVVAEKTGAKGSAVVLVGAHYDSAAGTPGADDNASGVAAMLELARAFSKRTPGLTVRFVAFVSEEPPFFYTRQMGSRHHAKMARQRGDRIKLMLSLEMLGYYKEEEGSQDYPPLLSWFYPPQADFIGVVGDLGSRRLVRALSAKLKEAGSIPVEHASLPRLVPGVDLSDHWSFWKEGYPALMVTDTAFYRNPHYHEGSDTPETLDYGRMAELTRALEAAVAELAQGQR